jgi:hypothetical protein
MAHFTNRGLRAVLLALSLLGVARESVLPHSCATMGSGVVATPAITSTDDEARGATAHATEEAPARGAHDHAAHHGAAPSPAAADHTTPSEAPASHDCDCVGDCCCATKVSLAPASIHAITTIAIDDADASRSPANQYLPVAPPHLRPFAIGPPTGVAA